MYGQSEQRDNWTFDYPVKAVLVGAQKKLDYHKGRQEYYGNQLKEVADKVVEMAQPEEDEEDAQSAMLAFAYSGSNKAQQAQDRIGKIQGYLARHRQHVVNYTKFVSALRKQDPEKQLPCTVDDIAHFGLAEE